MNDVDIVLSHLKEFGPQSSWDWEADERFARAVGDSEAAEAIQEARSHPYLLVQQLAVMYSVRRITRRRLRALRTLARRGFVTAHWSGTGPGGTTQFGVNRVRMYERITWAAEGAEKGGAR